MIFLLLLSRLLFNCTMMTNLNIFFRKVLIELVLMGEQKRESKEKTCYINNKNNINRIKELDLLRFQLFKHNLIKIQLCWISINYKCKIQLQSFVVAFFLFIVKLICLCKKKHQSNYWFARIDLVLFFCCTSCNCCCFSMENYFLACLLNFLHK